MAQSGEVDTATLCKIINNAGFDVIVGMRLTASETQSKGSIVNPDRSFEILPIASGAQSIRSGQPETVILNRSFNADDGNTEEETAYSVILCKSDWFSPVANLIVTRQWSDDDGPDFYKDQILAAGSLTEQEQSVKFFQTIAAYPDSQLATDYVKAMSSICESPASAGLDDAPDKVLDAMEAGVNAFFAATKNYKLVTLASIKMVELYYDLFPFGWALYKEKLTYFLYGSDGSKTQFVGSIAMLRTSAPDIARPNAGYAISFYPALTPADTSRIAVDTDKVVPLYYHQGLFVETITSDVPQIALKGLFQIKRNFTAVSTDTMIIPVLSGTVNGITVIGFDEDQATAPDDSTMDWLRSLFAPKTAQAIFDSINQILGALMMLHFADSLLLETCQWLRNKISGRKPVRMDEIKQRLKDFETEARRMKMEIADRMQLNSSEFLPVDSASAIEQASSANNVLQGEIGKVKMNQRIRELSDSLAKLQTYAEGNDVLVEKLTEATDSLLSSAETLTQAKPDELNALLEKTIAPEITTTVDKIIALSEDVSKSVGEHIKSETEEVGRSVSEVRVAIDEQIKTAEELRQENSRPDLEAEAEPLP